MKEKKYLTRGCLVLAGLVIFHAAAQARPQRLNKYDRIIGILAARYQVEASLVHSIIRAESNYNSLAVSTKGAVGLMQLMPETAEEYGVKDIYDPWENIEAGVRYLKDLIRLYEGKLDLVLAAYNAGQVVVNKYRGVPPFPETEIYLKRVKASGIGKLRTAKETVIYKFYDKSGRLVITNDRSYYLSHKH